MTTPLSTDDVATRNAAATSSAGLASALSGVGGELGYRSITGTSVSDPEAAYASLIRRQQGRFEQDALPAIRNTVASLDDTSIVDGAIADTGSGLERARGVRARNLARLGQSSSAIQTREFERRGGLGAALGDVGDINTARVTQVERNEGLRNELINVGRGIQSSASAGLSAAATSATNRAIANEQREAQESAQRTQTAASLGSIAILALAGL